MAGVAWPSKKRIFKPNAVGAVIGIASVDRL
jgi:hypothetical protein